MCDAVAVETVDVAVGVGGVTRVTAFTAFTALSGLSGLTCEMVACTSPS